VTPLYVDQLWRLATQEAQRRQRPIMYVFADLLREEVRRQALEEAAAEALQFPLRGTSTGDDADKGAAFGIAAAIRRLRSA
jgi:hypothetical protein